MGNALNLGIKFFADTEKESFSICQFPNTGGTTLLALRAVLLPFGNEYLWQIN